jgi:peptidoglycan/xylan/chitin deacetylase (PgdA/CDA1 family)
MRPGEPSAAEFALLIRTVARYFHVTPLLEAVTTLRDGRLPPRSLSITFDDGYADNVDVALPVLRSIGVPATFFIATGFLDGSAMWNDRLIEAVRRHSDATLDLHSIGLGVHDVSSWSRKRAVSNALIQQLKYLEPSARDQRVAQVERAIGGVGPRGLMMSRDNVRTLIASGMDVGAHTITHPILASVSLQTAREEIAGGKADLESITFRPVRVFAYPNGSPNRDFSKEHVDLVAACGFEAAVTTAWGAASVNSSPFQLPRFTPWQKSPQTFILRLLHNCTRVNPEVAH